MTSQTAVKEGPPPPVTEDATPGAAVSVRGGPPSPLSTVGLRPLDALLPLSLALWVVSVRAVKPAAMNDFGLLPALPVAFFVALGLLVASIVLALLRDRLSPVRLGLHLVAFVAVLHGTVPLLFTQPIYPWVYKHLGVVNYINLHGRVDASLDIYHNWPGFFALAAWLTRITGVGTPLAYAAWAPVYFNLLVCLMLAFVHRSLPVTPRVRWLASFLFVAGNWVGQDYFAPQAVAFVLSMAVFGMALAWLHADRPPAAVRAVRRLARRASRPEQLDPDEPEGAPPARPPSQVPALVALFVVFTVLVVSHQLSPYFVLLGLGLLTMAGMIRPRWVVAFLAAITIGYLLVHFSYIERTQDLFGSLGDPFNNIRDASSDSVAMRGRRLTTLAAPALSLGLWGLGALGVVRRLRRGRPTLALAILASAPVAVALGQSYGGEAVFRIYLFSLPWTAVLAAAALDPRSGPRRLWVATRVGVVLAVTVTLFLSAFYGSVELYVMRPGEVEASQYFYDHAEPDSVLTLGAANFPARLGSRYDEFRLTGDHLPNLLTTVEEFRHRTLGAEDLPAIEAFVTGYVPGAGRRYLALSTGQAVYSEVLGLVPPGSLASLDAALAQSPNWSVYHRNADAVIYRFEPTPLETEGEVRPAEPAPRVSRPADPDGSVHWPGLVVAVFGVGLLGVAMARRWTAAERHVEDVCDREETMDPIRATKRSTEAPGGDAQDDVPEEVAEAVPAESGLEEGAAAVPLRAQGTLPPPLSDPSASVRAAAVASLDLSQDGASVLLELLRVDLAAEVRVAAIGALTRAPESDQLSALSVALADPDPHVRAAALDTLPVAETAGAASLVLGACGDEHDRVRRAAYRRLTATPSWVLWHALERGGDREEIYGVLEHEASRDRLEALAIERMASPDPAHRAVAVELAGRAGTAECLRRTVDALRDGEPTVRRAAVGQLRGHTEILPSLVATLQYDPDPSVRTEAALALRASDADVALLALVGALQDPEWSVRRIAIESLVNRPSPGLAHRVAAELTTANMVSAGEVLLGMGAVGEDALAAVLVEGPKDRATAAAGLLRTTRMAERLAGRLRTVDPAARLRAVEALGALGGSEAVDALVASLSDSSPRVRSRAAFHLGELGGERAGQALHESWQSDPAVEVVEAAREAFRFIEARAPEISVANNGHSTEGSPHPADM
jgi:HEAT repeat protein